MKISKDDVLHVADLAHLELNEAEVETFRAQLDAILSYIDKLKQLDVTRVEPMTQVLHAVAGLNITLRSDIVNASNVAVPVLKQAPESKTPYFRVPRIIER